VCKSVEYSCDEASKLTYTRHRDRRKNLPKKDDADHRRACREIFLEISYSPRPGWFLHSFPRGTRPDSPPGSSLSGQPGLEQTSEQPPCSHARVRQCGTRSIARDRGKRISEAVEILLRANRREHELNHYLAGSELAAAHRKDGRFVLMSAGFSHCLSHFIAQQPRCAAHAINNFFTVPLGNSSVAPDSHHETSSRSAMRKRSGHRKTRNRPFARIRRGASKRALHHRAVPLTSKVAPLAGN